MSSANETTGDVNAAAVTELRNYLQDVLVRARLQPDYPEQAGLLKGGIDTAIRDLEAMLRRAGR